ncbi:acyl-CoA thioesterase [Roseibium aestuarii]|uniref:Acyl-CoA thioesterase n=1 Tax=Roseibium aestuarii TaxID=2600299 RepID=A0ABW4JWM1_9HYPH|nr:thioesterase family protein [Roseibium aestuarii]
MKETHALAERDAPLPRASYPQFISIDTRWADVDVYGHLNNVVFYSYFDTAVNNLLITKGLLDPAGSPQIFLVVETGCRYFREAHHPARLDIGVAVERAGTSSVTYRLGAFVQGADLPAVEGRFVHVLVDRTTRRPVPLTAALRAHVETLALRQS